MATLSRELRRELERTVIKARSEAESGAKKALEQLAVHNHEPWSGMTADQRSLRNRLRAHGRQLGDRRDVKSDKQTTDHLVTECAYEHWHRMLFARFLAECDLLIEPGSGVPISLAECQELARERDTDWLALASSFAVRMLPQIFRAGDPVLEVSLPPETRHVLEELLKSLAREVFIAEDSLGWVYQFWQTEQKDQVNASEVKIGADELAAVTQLFTEDYMVLFILHNTLGAWWAAKRKTEGKEWVLPGYEWTYLRFGEDGAPAAGSFDGWPRASKEIRVLDPCEGSGHFLVFALPILVAFRMEEEGLSRKHAVEAVLRDNIFGLELDLRCTQIAAFNLALTAWRMVGHCTLPQLNIACSGLGINAKEEDWVRLAGKDERLRGAMKSLFDLFQQAGVLGSLIDPKRVGGDLFIAEFSKFQPLLESALGSEQADETTHELAVTAQGLVQAVRILAGSFTLVATNVPYLGRGKQGDLLLRHCEDFHPLAKADLATCFVERCLSSCSSGGTAALVTPQSWLYLTSYAGLRQKLLKSKVWNMVIKLGPRAFEAVSGEVVNVALVLFTNQFPVQEDGLVGLDVGEERGVADKTQSLLSKSMLRLNQSQQLSNPDARIILNISSKINLLKDLAEASHGQGTFDSPRFSAHFWEIPRVQDGWVLQQSTPDIARHFGGCHFLLRWEGGTGSLAELMKAKEEDGYSSGKWKAGVAEWGKEGILIGQMGDLPCTLYLGSAFDENASVVIPYDSSHLPALWSFCSSDEFRAALKDIDQSIKITCKTLVKVPFDLAKWQKLSTEEYPTGLPKPHSDDPTQWLFDGLPRGSQLPLHVAVARLLGYRWPRQCGASVAGSAPMSPDSLQDHADRDGIVCLNPAKGEQPAAARLRSLLADTFGGEWSGAKQAELLSQVGYGSKSLEEWLRDGFFEQHCETFRQRPFVWHVWDGLKDGFHALVNYHKLAESNGVGRRTLEKLIYTYLGDWTERQRADQRMGIEGADARVAAAVHLKAQLEKILEGEPPFDIFARWKPLHRLSIGWEPDINDGVRINIRPFITAKTLDGRAKNSCILRYAPNIKWDKDRGKEPRRAKEQYPWFWSWDGATTDFNGGKEFDGNRWNDLHYSRKRKQTAREHHTQNQSKPESRP